MTEIQENPPPEKPSEKASLLPSSSAGPTLPSLAALKSWLPLYLHKSDACLLHLSRILSGPSGTDTCLLLLCYSALAGSSLLASLSARRLRASASKLLDAAMALPPHTTLLIAAPSARPPRLLRAAASLKALSSLISDFRIFARLWGLLAIYQWGRAVCRDPPRDGVLRGVAYLQVAANVAFQGLENGAYLASKGVLGWDEKRQSKAWLWACRFWAAHVGLDLYRLVYMKSKRTDGDNDGEVEHEGWWRDVVVNLAWAPLTMHWSLEGGFLSDLGVGLLGSTVGVIRMNGLWKATA